MDADLRREGRDVAELLLLQPGEQVEPKVGNALPLKSIPLGTAVHNVELTPGRGGQIARAAGQLVMLNNREAGYALVRLPSGEIRSTRPPGSVPAIKSPWGVTARLITCV